MTTRPSTERLDISDRDPDTLTPLEKLAYAYPDVHALMIERDQARARVHELEQRARDAMRGNASEGDDYDNGWISAAQHILGEGTHGAVE